METFGGFSFPIRRRGHFRTDDFFRDFQSDFDSAISGVMDRFGGRSLLADQFSNYRSLRDRARKSPSSPACPGQSIDFGADTAAASISETNNNYMIVLDMSDYVQGSISVETRGLYAVVEASIQKNTFKRKYPLPSGTNTERVVAALSDEGILTISAPKKGAKSATTSISDGSDKSFSPLKIDVGQPDRKDSTASERSVNLIIEGDSGDIPQTEDGDTPIPTSSIPVSPPADDKRVLSISKKGKFFQDGYFENVWQDFEKAMDEMVEKDRKKEAKQNSLSKEELTSKLQEELFAEAQRKQQQQDQEEQLLREERQKQQLEKKRQDQLQQEQQSSSSSIEEIMRPQFTRLNSYRNLRRWAPEDTQAATLTKDQNGYKIVMDVKEFADADATLNIKGTDNGLNVSGSKGGLSFERSFTLPGLADPEQVNATMSEDGVLTITAPTGSS